MPKVLVLLATYNGEKWLGEQCDTILGQSNVDVRLVVSDDESSDGTYGVLCERRTADPRVSILPRTSRAGSAGKNFYRLIRDADIEGCDFVAFSDQDDTWHLDKLSRACAALAASGAAGYSSAVTAVYENGRTAALRQSSRTTPVDFLFEGAGQGCTFVLRGTVFLEVQKAVRLHWKQICQVHHHDWMVYALCRSWGRAWHFDPLPSIDYRQHSANELGARSALAGVTRRWGLIRSGWYRAQIEAVCGAIVSVGRGDALASFLQLQAARKSLRGQLNWLVMLSKYGRRKLTDRIVLIAATLSGHI